MNEAVQERILDATVEVLRRHGPDKTSVVDVARALGMSHANVYRYFASKRALLDAVAARWLHGISEPLEAIVREPGPAPERLRRWFDALLGAKRRRAEGDPELFAMYHAIASDAREVVAEHVAALHRQLAQILEDGVRRQEFRLADPQAAARAVFDATIRFHHPSHVMRERTRPLEDEFAPVFALLLAGLRSGVV
jgi:AcrR family transcriptional regulator